MVLGGAKSNQFLLRTKHATPDSWEKFLEEVDAPKWADLALEGNPNTEDSISVSRNDTWFDTVHPFHQCSFQDLVSSSSLGDKVNGKLSKTGYLSPIHVHSVSKSRGRKYESQAWSRKKVGNIPFKLLDSKGPSNYKTRPWGGKISSCKSNSEGNLGPDSCLPKPSNDTRARASIKMSTSTENESKNAYEQSEPSRVVNVSKDSAHDQSEPSRDADLHIQSTVAEIKATIPRTTGLLAVLKASTLRRSHGALPALRVEVKDEQQLRDSEASGNQARTESIMAKDRKASCNSKSQKVNKDSKTVGVKHQTGSFILSPTRNRKEKSNIGSLCIYEASNTINKDEGTSAKLERKTFSSAKVQQGRSIKGSRQPLREITNAGIPQCTGVSVRNSGSADGEKENKNKIRAPHQKVNIEGRKKPLTSIKKTTCSRVVQGSRQPLREITDVGIPQCMGVSVRDKGSTDVEKENKNIVTAPHQKVNIEGRRKPITSIKKTTCGHVVQARVNDSSLPRVKASHTQLVGT